MIKEPVILSSSMVRNGLAVVDGKVVLKEQGDDFNRFSRSLYKTLELQYPKFFKMDHLCKLAFLASELIWTANDPGRTTNGSRVAVVLCNRASSLDTDRNFYSSISSGDYFPSPAVFVYTLPNIMIGEICIRKNITGENAFFIFDRFDPAFLFEYVSELIGQGRADACLCGWCDYDEGKYDAFFALAGRSEHPNKNELFTVDNLTKLYKSNT
jgi:hypothetical protein